MAILLSQPLLQDELRRAEMLRREAERARDRDEREKEKELELIRKQYLVGDVLPTSTGGSCRLPQ